MLNILGAIGGDVADWVQRAAEVTVTEGDFYGTGRLPSQAHRSVFVDQRWSVGDASAALVSSKAARAADA